MLYRSIEGILMILLASMWSGAWACTTYYQVIPGSTVTYTTINAALDAIDYNDGCSDVILISPGVYDEQIVAKGNAGADSSPFPIASGVTLTGIENAYTSHSDPLILRGSDPTNPPVLTVASSTPEYYGFFPPDPLTSFLSGIVLCGNDISFQNVEVRRGSATTYAINGMASSTVFEDCLFTVDGGNPSDDFMNLTNNHELTSPVNPAVSADNEVTVLNCQVDMEQISNPGFYYNGYFLYFHGFSDGLDLSPVGGFTVSGCVIKNAADGIVGFRGNRDVGTGLAHFTFTNNFASDIASRTLWLDGNVGPAIIQRNIFAGISIGPALDIDDKNGELPKDVLVSDNIFSEIASNALDFDLLGTPDNTPNWRIINNTFYDYSAPAVDVGGTNAGIVTIANNIFAASSDSTGVTAVNISASIGPTVKLYSNLYHNNGVPVSDPNSRVTVNLDGMVEDPQFANTSLVEPATPGEAFSGEPFVLSAASPARDSGNNTYALGSLDVDGDARIEPDTGTVDRGAQEFIAPPPTPTPLPEVWVDFGYIGTELGTESQPFNKVQEGVDVVQVGGTLFLKPGSTDETIRITKAVRIEVPNGSARIGVTNKSLIEEESEETDIENVGIAIDSIRSTPFGPEELIRLIERRRAGKSAGLDFFHFGGRWVVEENQ